MIKAVIFDLDGVLIDSEKYHHASFNYALKELGLKLKISDFRKLFGTGALSIIDGIFYKNGIKKDALPYVRKKDDAYRKLIKGKLKTIPGAKELLIKLSRKYKIALASSTALENLNMIIKKIGIEKYLDYYISGATLKQTKPNPEIFLKCASALKVKNKECVVIEDAKAGIEAAKSAGMKCIGVAFTLPKSYLKEADLIVDKIADISLDMIKAL